MYSSMLTNSISASSLASSGVGWSLTDLYLEFTEKSKSKIHGTDLREKVADITISLFVIFKIQIMFCEIRFNKVERTIK